MSNQPIGIFDSGIGGLTIARAIVDTLPAENIIYFGDTAHFPYGDKSAEALQSYSLKIARLLLERNCKLILIACNSASTAAYEAIQETLGSKAIIMNVIDPVITALKPLASQHTKIGLIGTRQTVQSKIYDTKIATHYANIQLVSCATNILASAIEEFGDHPVTTSLIQAYLSNPALENIHGLILACTHYPVIKDKISAFFQHKIDIIDASQIVARAVAETLKKNHLQHNDGIGTKHFYVSDYTESFAHHAKRFFSDAIKLEHFPLTDEMEAIA
ncbi:MAG: glutamate racemase [Gammaproteobacteria bacterium]|nr:glutamate racemase [Gammaproteobacteria bacterium]